MIEKALVGNRRYWAWIAFLLAIMAVGALFYYRQFQQGLRVTNLGRDVTWGFYIAQFTFMVGVAASAVMVVLPYYAHQYKEFSKITILGEFIAIPSVLLCMLFIVVDMGQPTRVLNVMLHPTLNSLMFWDMVSLGGYLVLNVIIGWKTLMADRSDVPPPRWIKPLIYLSIPWAVSIHTVTAFLYSGLAARPFWLTAIMAPRFLATAFSAGPALLILFCLLIRRVTHFDPGDKPIQKLAQIVTYAMVINIFFLLLELFTALYSNMPEHVHHFQYLFLGIHGSTSLVPWMWLSVILAAVSLVLLLVPRLRQNTTILAFASVAVILSIWTEKGLSMIVAGFVPTTLGKVVNYFPSLSELVISLSIYAFGALVVTILYKVAIAIRESELTY